MNYLRMPEFYLSVFLMIGAALVYSRQFSDKEPMPPLLSQPARDMVMSLPLAYTSWIRKTMHLAGLRSASDLATFCSIKLYGALFAFVAFSLVNIWLSPVVAVWFFLGADGVVLFMMKRRQQRLREALPRVLDVMVLCADAGLGLSAMIQRVIGFRSKIGSELREEFEILGRDLVLGMDSEKAYRDLYERTGLDELRSLGSVLLQSTTLGIGVSRVLRAQSDFIRTRLLQNVEERAHKIPVYMIFPMWFGVMPAVFLVLVAPSIIKTLQILAPMGGML